MALQNLPIKPASTPTVATDTAAVVALHPSSPLPVGTNAIGTVTIANLPATTGRSDVVLHVSAVPSVTTLPALATGANSIGTVGVTALPALPTGNNIIGQVKEYRAATSTNARVASLATTATLLAANANRNGATIYNESTATLYLKLGATASNVSYTIQIAAGGYYEVPAYYSGIIDGIWATAQGAAQVTEVS